MAGKIPVLLFSLLLVAPTVSVAQSNITVYSDLTVNAGRPIRTADPLWFGIGTTIWDNYLDTPQTLTLLTNMGTQALRFPGGSVSDQYHWINNIDAVGQYSFQESLASFIHVATNVNAQAMITVNYGTGTPSEAAAWVAYVNATTNNPQYLGVDSTGADWHTAGYWASLRAAAPLAVDDGMNFLRISRPEPLGFKYWEIGNEVYGYWETDVNFVSHDPYTYAVRAQEYISLMKAVDPTVKIGVVACPGASSYVNNTYHPAVDPVTQQTYNGWTPVLLATLASLDVTPDFAIMHWYTEVPGEENDALLLQVSSGWAANASDLRGQINDYLGPTGANVELICTENNSDVAIPGKQSVSLVNGLYKVDSLGQLMQTEFNGLFWHDFRDGAIVTIGNMNPALYGWRLFGDFGVATETNLYPTYSTTELIRHFAQGGDTVIAAASDDSLLSIYAVRRQDGSLTVLAINKDPLNTNTAQVSVAGFTPASKATVYSYGIPQDTAAETGIGLPDISQTNFSITGTSFSYTFPPYSATVLVLSNEPTTGPSTTTIASSQNPAVAGSGLTLTATVSGGGAIPAGFVVFNDGTTNLGIGTLNNSGTATLTTATLSASGSPHSITAVYSGDGAYAGSASSALLQVVSNKASVTTNGLLVCWLFNEGSGTNVADSSGNGNTGTLHDSPVWTNGLNGTNALEFPGAYVPSAAYVSVPASATLADQGTGSNITICAWVKRSSASLGNYSAIVAKDTPFDVFPWHRNYELMFDTAGRLLFVYRNSAGSNWEIYSSYGVCNDTNNWHYYCVTYTYGNASSCALYMDGVAVSGGWTTGNGSDAPASTSGGPVLIGMDGAGTPSYGSIYQGISIYSVLLSAPQVLILYDSAVSTGAASTTALASSQNPAPGDTVVTFAATVSASGVTPAGTVVFFDGNNNLGSATLNTSGVASLAVGGLSVKGSNHPVTAVYNGGGGFAASSSSVLTQLFNVGPSATAISSSQNPAVGGSPVTFTATVSGGAATPTGTVVFNDGTNFLGGGTLDSSGGATLSTSALSVTNSPHSMTVFYSGDSNYIGSGSGALLQIIGPAPSTNTMTSSQNPAAARSVVTFTATVTGSIGTPTGTVTIYDGASPLGSGNLNGSGVVLLSTRALSAAGSPHSITTVYGGDGNYTGSTSAVLLQIITNSTGANSNGLCASWPFNEGFGTTVSDASSNGNTGALVNSPLWVAGPAGHNALQFSGSSPSSAAYVSVPDSDTLSDQDIGSQITICAWIKRSPASIGNYCSVIAKAIQGDRAYHRNYELLFDTGNHILFIFGNSAGTSWEMYSSDAAYADTNNWHFYCVTYTYGTASSCALYVDGTPVSGGWVAGNGSDAPASTSGGPVLIGIDGAGTVSYGSIYDGISIYDIVLSASQVQSNYNSGLSAGVASATTLASSQNPAPAGSPVTFTATVSGTGGTPAGMVLFYDGTTSLGTATLDSSGTATLATAALTLIGSPHSITAVYVGDSTFAGSTSAVLAQCIACSSAMVSIPLINPSFEIPAVAQGTTAVTVTGWVASLEGSYGVYYPAAGVYTNVVNDVLPPPADASQVLFIKAGNYLAQFLTNTLAPNQTYTLSGAIGNRGDGTGLAPGDIDFVNLLAGSTIIAQSTNLPHPNPGGFLPWAVTYSSGASGFPSGTLQIQLGQHGTGEVHYDNISLTATDPPAQPQIMAADASFGFLAGQFGFDLSAAARQTVVVDGSTDLVNWTPLYTNAPGAGTFYFRDPLSSNLPWRFYRARSQ
jgi:alpha-L-arabinofuranosidase